MFATFVNSVIERSLACAILAGSLAFVPAAGSAPSFASGVQIGQTTASALKEVSGMAASRNNPGVIWAHNDSASQLHAISADGALLGTYRLAGVSGGDYEDLAIGPGPMPGVDYLFLGDIGDNSERREEIEVHQVPEPSVYPALPLSGNISLKEAIAHTLVYPDGPKNAEGLMADPWTGDIFIVSKEAGKARVYQATRAQLESGGAVTLLLAAQVDFDVASAADISPDGREIIIRREDFALLWQRAPGQSVAAALAGAPMQIPILTPPTEPNGEAVAFDPFTGGYYSMSEGTRPPIHFYARTSQDFRPAEVPLLGRDQSWSYLDSGSNLGAEWRSPDFNDHSWPSGPAQLGYGQEDERTVIGFGGNEDLKHITTYFRAQFSVANAATFGALRLKIVFDDGIAVFLNGAEAHRENLAADAAFDAKADSSRNTLENIWSVREISAAALREGSNVLAVEVHRASEKEADLSFDLQLAGLPRAQPPELRFSEAPRWSGGELTLFVRGPAGAQAVVEVSQDLNSWSQAGVVHLPSGEGAFVTPAPPGEEKFFRLRSP